MVLAIIAFSVGAVLVHAGMPLLATDWSKLGLSVVVVGMCLMDYF
jgi:hypothetical protein